MVNRGEVQIDGEWIPCAIKRVRNGKLTFHGLIPTSLRYGINANSMSLT